jgi:hypothetical protein
MALACAERDLETAQNFGAQHLPVPFSARVSKCARIRPERESELLFLIIREPRVPARMRSFSQTVDAALQEFDYPTLDRARVIAKRPGHAVAACAFSHEHHAVEPVH